MLLHNTVSIYKAAYFKLSVAAAQVKYMDPPRIVSWETSVRVKSHKYLKTGCPMADQGWGIWGKCPHHLLEEPYSGLPTLTGLP